MNAPCERHALQCTERASKVMTVIVIWPKLCRLLWEQYKSRWSALPSIGISITNILTSRAYPSSAHFHLKLLSASASSTLQLQPTLSNQQALPPTSTMAAATAYFLVSPTNPSNANYNASSSTSRSSSNTMSVEQERALYFKNQAADNVSETSSFISMDKFMSQQATSSSSSKRQAVSSKLREWRSESAATWRKVKPYYREFQYWVMMGPH